MKLSKKITTFLFIALIIAGCQKQEPMTSNLISQDAHKFISDIRNKNIQIILLGVSIKDTNDIPMPEGKQTIQVNGRSVTVDFDQMRKAKNTNDFSGVSQFHYDLSDMLKSGVYKRHDGKKEFISFLNAEGFSNINYMYKSQCANDFKSHFITLKRSMGVFARKVTDSIYSQKIINESFDSSCLNKNSDLTFLVNLEILANNDGSAMFENNSNVTEFMEQKIRDIKKDSIISMVSYDVEPAVLISQFQVLNSKTGEVLFAGVSQQSVFEPDDIPRHFRDILRNSADWSYRSIEYLNK